jgi:hypothetical protein
MVQSGEELSESEEEDLDRFVKRFNRQSRVLPKYASLNTADKEKLISEEEECVKKSKEEDISRKEEVRLKFRAAEINSGIPAVELAIKQYLEKYAISIKIKTAHDSFMKKVNERKMMDNCKAEWAESKASFDSMKRNIREKREKYDYAQKLPIYKSKIEKIKLNTKGIKGEQVRVTKEINQLVKNQKEKIGIDEAEYILGRFQEQLQAIGEEAQINLENEFNNSIRNSCQEMVEEYTDYIKKLDTEGYFNIGSLDLKQMADFDMFDMNRAEDFMADEKYVSTERVKTGTERVKKRGFFSGLARFFGVGGYETVDVYEEQQFVMIKQLIRDQVTEIQHEFDTEMNMTIKNTEEKVQAYKDKAISKVEQLDEKVQGWLGEIDQMLENQEKLQKEVRENETKAKWLEDFVKEVDGLLAV